MGIVYDASDPFSEFLVPPAGETPDERAQRENREADAQRVSDTIDEDIKKTRLALKKEKNMVKVLLLGQSESGKSTTLKNFRMRYAHAAWKEERQSWRAVIQLNLIRSIVTIVETIQREMLGSPSLPGPIEVEDDTEKEDQDDGPPIQFSDKHNLLKLRLGPLRRVEEDLKRRLGAGSEELQATNAPMRATPFDPDFVPDVVPPRGRRTGEFVVRCWQDAFRARPHSPTGPVASSSRQTGKERADVDDATEIIGSCKDDMKALWEDRTVRTLLEKRNIRLQDSAGFFLDDLDRIATPNYVPSDDDVLRARLRTMGVQEHKLHLDDANSDFVARLGMEFGREWIMYDVGGARTSRAAWLPYFENVNAIIFLAPISCFDERLAEDPKINRLQDSFILWRSICETKLLSKTTMIVFLNKCDLLKRKLKHGIMVNKYLPSYGSRSNDLQTVVKYLREKFKDTSKQFSPEPRTCYLYATSVTDTKATATTLKSVRDGILREHLKKADFV